MAKPGTGPRDVVGVGMLGRETCVTGGDLAGSRVARQPLWDHRREGLNGLSPAVLARGQSGS